jgi:predicted phage baseplate assembly protein
VRWEQRAGFLFAPAGSGGAAIGGGGLEVVGPDARVFYVEYDENDFGHVCFGDSVFGMVPPVGSANVRFSALFSAGAAGNVPIGAITEVLSPPALPNLVVGAGNERAAAGGADHESIEQAVRVGPKVFRSGQRAVTQSDYEALALAAGGVARARVRSRVWNQCDLYIAPAGPSFRPIPEDLKLRLLAFFEDRRMVGTVVHIRDAVGVPVDIACEVVMDPRYHLDSVRQAAQDAVEAQLAYDHQDFGRTLYLSDFYAAIEAAPGVQAVTISRFQRRGSISRRLADLRALGLTGPVNTLPEFIQQALRVEVEPDGRIETSEIEIPHLGDLQISVIPGTAR